MGFWDIAKGIGKGVAKTAMDKTQEIKTLSEEYQYKDDSELKRLFKNGDTTQRLAANKVLRARGYTKETI